MAMPSMPRSSPTGATSSNGRRRGSAEAWQKANALWKQHLPNMPSLPIDAAIAAELDAFVARRIAEGGQPTDF